MNYLTESLTVALLTREQPIDLVRCPDCGKEYRANGMGHLHHIEHCKGRNAK